MRIKKYFIIILILIILVNITSINATENDNQTLESTDENIIQFNENTIDATGNMKDALSQHKQNINQQDILKKNNEEILRKFEPWNTIITLTVNDTTNFETTGNITINMHLTFLATEHDGEFPTHNVTIYENNTIIKKINIGEQNLPEIKTWKQYHADILFNYTVHENSHLTTHLFHTYSNPLYFKK